MTDLITIEQIQPADAPLVGGKALSLARLMRAGLPVPPGFCLTTAVFLRFSVPGLAADPALLEAITRECEKLGPVAVRSSAVAEDGDLTSFAGQHETFLGVVGRDAVVRAVESCWASLDGERAAAYRHAQGVTGGRAMAVVVQRWIAAETAGVLFTLDPLTVTDPVLLVEAARGPGEGIVSGRAAPERFRLDRNGRVLNRQPAGAACLDDSQLAHLASLARRVEQAEVAPRDVEFVWSAGVCWLLQARPITASAADREQVRREEIAALRAAASPRGTVWSRSNLAESLPTPTPMTWAIVSRHLLSATGGFGLMYRDLGYDPDPTLVEGAYDLVCGRPYRNLSREPRLLEKGASFEYPFAALKADPRQALDPSPTLSRRAWQALPRLTWQALAGGIKRRRLRATFARRFREEIAPAFAEGAIVAGRVDLAALADSELLAFFREWVERTLVGFARESLKPTALAALALAALERELREAVGPESAAALSGELVVGAVPPAEADLARGIRDLASGKIGRAEFLERFGHRAGDEMELATPRWREDPFSLPQCEPGIVRAPSRSTPGANATRLAAEQHAVALAAAAPLRELIGLRDAAKHYLMMGYALIRAALVEVGRRSGLGESVFFLTPEELPAALRGEDLAATAARRRRRRARALGLEVPPVLFSDDLDAVGRPIEIEAGEVRQGVAVSPGVAEGPALVRERPEPASGEGFILVCPSADPAWVPLFARARGVIMETGGVLSHGAIVAREFGLPAVAGLPDVVRSISQGLQVRVDGSRGTVTLIK